jgi:hypothetical protein
VIIRRRAVASARSLHIEPGFERLKEQVRSIVGMLGEKSNIPMVREQMPLIAAGVRVVWNRRGRVAAPSASGAASIRRPVEDVI